MGTAHEKGARSGEPGALAHSALAPGGGNPALCRRPGLRAGDVVICRDMGAKATMLCSELGIETFAGTGDTVKELFTQWKEGSARKLGPGEGCKH